MHGLSPGAGELQRNLRRLADEQRALRNLHHRVSQPANLRGRRLQVRNGADRLQWHVRRHTDQQPQLRCVRYALRGRYLVRDRHMQVPGKPDTLLRRLRQHVHEQPELWRLRQRLRAAQALRERDVPLIPMKQRPPLIALRILAITLVLGALWAGISCTGESTASNAQPVASCGPTCSPDIDSIRTTIFLPSCVGAGCHNVMEHAGGLDLESTGVDTRLVRAGSGTRGTWTLVLPQMPDDSLLFQKVAGAPSPCGFHMPLAKADIETSLEARLKEWVSRL